MCFFLFAGCTVVFGSISHVFSLSFFDCDFVRPPQVGFATMICIPVRERERRTGENTRGSVENDRSRDKEEQKLNELFNWTKRAKHREREREKMGKLYWHKSRQHFMTWKCDKLITNWNNFIYYTIFDWSQPMSIAIAYCIGNVMNPTCTCFYFPSNWRVTKFSSQRKMNSFFTLL